MAPAPLYWQHEPTSQESSPAWQRLHAKWQILRIKGGWFHRFKWLSAQVLRSVGCTIRKTRAGVNLRTRAGPTWSHLSLRLSFLSFPIIPYQSGKAESFKNRRQAGICPGTGEWHDHWGPTSHVQSVWACPTTGVPQKLEVAVPKKKFSRHRSPPFYNRFSDSLLKKQEIKTISWLCHKTPCAKDPNRHGTRIGSIYTNHVAQLGWHSFFICDGLYWCLGVLSK